MAKVYRHTQARMFKSDLLEFFSKVHPVVPFLIFAPVVAWFSVGSLQAGLDLGPWLVCFALGLLLWTLAEYLLHRFLFHIPERGPVSRWINFTFHGVHHSYPDDRFRLVMVPAVSLPFAGLFCGLFSLALPPEAVGAAFAGFVGGYLVYDYTHWATHFLRPSRRPLLRPLNRFVAAARKRHMRHHFKAPDLGYGVSFPLWDHVFRTFDPKSR